MLYKVIEFFSFMFKMKKIVASEVQSPVSQSPVEAVAVKPKLIRVAFIVPHTLNSPGAEDYNGEKERFTQERVCKWAKDYINFHLSDVAIAELFYRDVGGLDRAYKDAAVWDADIAIEPHLNWFDGPAYGFMWIVPDTSEESIRFGRTLADRFWTHYNIKRRNGDGLEKVKSPFHFKKTERGAGSVWRAVNNGIPIALILEPCFANRKTIESQKIVGNFKGYAEWLAKNIVEIGRNR